MKSAPDRTIDIRPEDSFDLEALGQWMQRNHIEFAGELTARQFKGGASNLTYLITDQNLNKWVMRTPPHGVKAASAHDMGREARVLTALNPHLRQAPKVLGYCDDESVIGRKFYVMQYVSGYILAKEIPTQLCPNPESVRELCESMVDALGHLHQVDLEATGLSDLDKGPGYVQRQVSGWSQRYRAARTPDVPEAEDVMDWLERNQPADVQHAFIHGDWRLDNLVVNDQAEIIGILDWEMSTVGDPCMDLGAALAYWVEAGDPAEFQILRLQPSDAEGMLTRAEVVARYSESASQQVRDSLEANWRFYEVYGLFRLAVIIQQIWARYSSGATTNPQFAGFGDAVNMLVRRTQKLISDS